MEDEFAPGNARPLDSETSQRIRSIFVHNVLPWISRVHRAVYRWTGGLVGGWLLGRRFLLLEHTGRKSGRRYCTPILYVADGERFVLAASNGGDSRHPAWWLNLQAQPQAHVQSGRRRVAVVASCAEADEAEWLWPVLTRAWPWFRNYRAATTRKIPVVVLSPVSEKFTEGAGSA